MKKLLIYSLTLWVGLQPLQASAQGLSAFADLLAWHASEQTAGIWANVITTPQPDTTDFTAKNINFNWEPGFKAGFIYEPEQGFFDTKLYWTYFSTKSSIHDAPSEQLFIPEFFSGFLSEDVFFGANLNWRLVMNMVDLQASHEFNVGKSFTLRPAIGVKGGTINQSAHTQWNAVLYTATEKVTHDFSGVGPSFGLDAKWNFYKNFDLVGNFSTALMWGNWNVKDTYVRPSAFLGLLPPTTITTKMNNSQLGTTMFDYFLGAQWHHEGRSKIKVRLGYEMQFWQNQLRTVTFQELPSHGDLTLQGATCGIYIEL